VSADHELRPAPGRRRTATGMGPAVAGGTLQEQAYTIEAPEGRDVVVSVSHCGVCFSDIDCIDNTFGYHTFPFVPGHEVIGTVEAVGPDVRHLAIGQRVGVGPNLRSCLRCDNCVAGLEQLCRSAQLTLAPGLNGGFANYLLAGSEWVFPIPEGLDPAEAAPLMCAGVTTVSPLRRHLTPTMRVGVIGIGGLGHLALQFASRMGADVTAIAAHPSARDEQLFAAFGANRVLDLDDGRAMDRAQGSYDFLLSTIYGASTSVKRFVRMLRANGRLCVVGAAMAPLDMPAAHLVLAQTGIVGSASGSRADARDMLEFAVRHGIRPMIEVVGISEVNDAVAAIRAGAPRFRMVLDTHA